MLSVPHVFLPDSLADEKSARRHYAVPASPLPPRTKWTRRVPPPVLIGHAASLTRTGFAGGAGSGGAGGRGRGLSSSQGEESALGAISAWDDDAIATLSAVCAAPRAPRAPREAGGRPAG